jgi:hypothetical protein
MSLATPSAVIVTRPRRWSLDAWAIVRPAEAFDFVASHPPPPGWRTALRRPLFVALVLGCGMSVLASGVLTLRLAVTSLLFWSYVPCAQVIGLALATRGRRRIGFSQMVDAFFVGNGTATLFLLTLVGVLSLLPSDRWWDALTGPFAAAWLASLLWSVRVDASFFRSVLKMTRGETLRALLLQRAVAWAIIFAVFAVPSPRLLWPELVDAVRELV